MRQQVEKAVRETIARELSRPCNRSKLYELIGVPDFVTPFPPTQDTAHRTEGDVRQMVDEEIAAVVQAHPGEGSAAGMIHHIPRVYREWPARVTREQEDALGEVVATLLDADDAAATELALRVHRLFDLPPTLRVRSSDDQLVFWPSGAELSPAELLSYGITQGGAQQP